MPAATKSMLIAETNVLRQRISELEKQLAAREYTEELLQKSEAQFRALVEASAQIVWMTDPAGLVVDASPSWLAFTGQSIDEMLNWGWSSAVHPDDREFTIRNWQTSVEKDTPINLEFRLWHNSGEWRWTTARAAPVYKLNGTASGWVGLVIDITERKHAEEALQKAHAELEKPIQQRAAELALANTKLQASLAAVQSFYDSAPFMMGIAELEEGKTIAVSANRATSKFLAIPSENLQRQTGKQLGNPEDFEQLWVEAYQRCQREKKTCSV